MPMQWHKLKIVGKCEHDDGYNQELVLWVEAYGRENAVAKAMIDQPLTKIAATGNLSERTAWYGEGSRKKPKRGVCPRLRQPG